MQFGKNVKVREEKFGSVIFETLTEKVYVTNDTGKEIVKLFAEGKGAAEITSELAGRYDCDAGEIGNDVKEYLDCLKKNNLTLQGDQNGDRK